MGCPFDLDNEAGYQVWRSTKLATQPSSAEDLRVEIAHLARPTPAELEAVRARVSAANMVLISAAQEQLRPDAILAFGRSLGLARTDANLFADERALSRITPATDEERGIDQRGDYVPYTNRQLSWHTDGYYNGPQAQARSWMLFCAVPAAVGGVNGLLDHEIAYIRLRDLSSAYIEALSHPEALQIPANTRDGQVLRPPSTGPVFSVRDGHLHMRYTARARNAIWRRTPDTDAARAALDRLFSSADAFTLLHKLESGEGIVSNNVLHNRSSFADEAGTGRRRLLYRIRYLDRIHC